MTIKEMHYDFKKKLNKVDSQQNTGLLIPEIDWALNEAQNVFIDMVAEPRLRTHLGFETSQKSIDDIRTMVENNRSLNIINFNNYSIIELPDNYKYYIKGEILISKGSCTDKKARLYIKEHDDEFEESPFDKSSFEWRVVNGLFVKEGIKIFHDGTFTHSDCLISYIREPLYIHNAENYRNGTYNLPSGQILTGHQDCELPKATHKEIVDLAVLITTGEIQVPDYQIKLAKIGLNSLVNIK